MSLHAPLAGKRVLLIISGGIAAYKALELIRLLRKAGCGVTCVPTQNAARFVTPLSLQALSENKVYADLFSLTDESEMGHIQLSRSADLLVVAPATANILAKMAAGICDDLASTVLLATDKPVLVAPAMNVRMWLHPATVANMATLKGRGVHVVDPTEGVMACNEVGPGRLAEPPEIVAAIQRLLAPHADFAGAPADGAAAPTGCGAAGQSPAAGSASQGAVMRPVSVRAEGNSPVPGPVGGRSSGINAAVRAQAAPYTQDASRPLAGQHALVTSGPTHEPIDPVRYIANRSSGKQGHAIAAALAALGARVTLVSGPVSVPDPPGVTVLRVETAREMLAACQSALPADIAVFAAAVADWRVENASAGKIKKQPGAAPPSLSLTPNPDILATIAAPGPSRPRLVIGFAAETHELMANAQSKLRRKNADWIVANDVSPATGIMGGADNAVHIVSASGIESWERLPKDEVARRLAARIAEVLACPPGASVR